MANKLLYDETLKQLPVEVTVYRGSPWDTPWVLYLIILG